MRNCILSRLIFNNKLPKYNFSDFGFREKLWLYKSHLWFSLLTQDFLQSYKYASKWVNLFKNHKELISLHPVFYLKGKNYLLEASFLVKNNQKFKEELNYFENEIENKSIPFNSNTEILIFLYFYTNKLHLHFLEATFSEGEYLVAIINTKIETYQSRLDNHHIVIFVLQNCLFVFWNE